MEENLNVLKRFNEIMNNPKIKNRKICSDITVLYDRPEIHHLYVTENINEYRHLLECYGISEKELKSILYEIKNPDKELVGGS